MNIVELNDLIRKISLACPLVNSYYNMSPYECWNTKGIMYGSVIMDVTNVSTNTAVSTYQCLFYYGDRLTEAKTNKNAIRTDAITVLDSIISKLYEQEGVSITYNQSYTLFEQKFEDELAGAYVTVDIQVMGDGMCGFDIEVGPDFEVVQLHETITENGLYEWKSGKDKYYDQVVLDVDVPKGLDVDFSVIYDSQSCNEVEQMINDDVAYTKSKEKPPTNDVSYFYQNDAKLVYAPQYFNNGDLFGGSVMISLYSGCTRLQYVPMIDTSSTQNMSSMFYGCSALTTIPQLDTSKVTNMFSMFYGCSSLQTIPLLDTSNVVTMNNMFNGCYNLTTIPQLDTSSVTKMTGIFRDCSALISIPQLDTSKVTDISQMFYNCSNLQTIPQLDTSSATTMAYMFYFCDVASISELDASKVTSVTSMFYLSNNFTDNLTDFGGLKDLGKAFISTSATSSTQNFDLSKRNNLTHESLMNVINNLYDLNLNSKGGKLTLGSTNRAKLTEDEIAIATNKGWTVS